MTIDQLTAQVTALENIVNIIQAAMNNLATKQQLTSLLSIRQADIESLKSRVTALETTVSSLDVRITALGG
jgi:polyhydroxyalkanoate synthesis regulator phasin